MSFNFGQTTGQSKGGFSFGTPSSTTTTGGLGQGTSTLSSLAATAKITATTAPTFGGFSLGASTAGAARTTTTTSTGSMFGGLGGLAGKAPATTAAGFNFGTTTTSATTTGLTLGGLTSTAATTSAPSLGFGGFKTGLTAATAASTVATTGLSVGPVFASTAQPIAKGLGGVDPQTKTSSTGNGTNNGKSSDSKAIKETNIPNEIAQTVDNFQKHIESQRSVREDISRLSSKPIFKVQEDVQTLRQMISVVSNGLQRNASAIDKLKAESSQELKHVEIARRTNDTPPGLQYENTAPIEYFQRLVEDFESLMIQYRQQIDNVENHFSTLNQPSLISLQDLTLLLRKLHETFIAFAAQLQAVHEAVKNQKEHYLNYRKVFLGDANNVFEARHKAAMNAAEKPSNRVGPTPFTGMSNAAAVAMASALNRGQQPAGAPPTVGLSTMLGTQTTQAPTLGTGLGLAAPTAATSTGFSFGTPAVQPTGFSFGTPSTSTFAASSPFQLQKPPAGSKRGKKS